MNTLQTNVLHEALRHVAGSEKALNALLKGKKVGESELIDRFVSLRIRLRESLPGGVFKWIPEKSILWMSVRSFPAA